MNTIRSLLDKFPEDLNHNLPGDDATEVEMIAYGIYQHLKEECQDQTIIYIGYGKDERAFFPLYKHHLLECVTRVSVLLTPCTGASHLAFSDDGVLLMPHWGRPNTSLFPCEAKYFSYADADEFAQLLPTVREYALSKR